MTRQLAVTGIALLALCLTGCGLSTFTQRETDPFIRDVLMNEGKPIAIMVTDSSRRLVYEFKNPLYGEVFCADAPPDTSIAASGAVGGNVTTTIHSSPNTDGSGSLNTYRTTGASTLPLVRRSQGLQYGRDLEAKECILFATGITTKTEYLTRIDKIRKDSKALINNEIKNGLGQLGIGTTPNQQNPPNLPGQPNPPN
jgi:hypothetical protein